MVGHLKLTRFILRAMWASVALLLIFAITSLATLSNKRSTTAERRVVPIRRSGPEHPTVVARRQPPVSMLSRATMTHSQRSVPPISQEMKPSVTGSGNNRTYKPTVFVEASRQLRPSRPIQSTESRARTLSETPRTTDSSAARVEMRLASMQRQLDRLSKPDAHQNPQTDVMNTSSQRQLENRLISLQQHFDQLAQSQSLQLLQQQQSEQLRKLQSELDEARRAAQQPSTPDAGKSNSQTLPLIQPAPSSDSPADTDRPPAALNTNDKSIIRFEKSGKQRDEYTLTIQEADIRQVLEMFAELSGRNIVVGRSVAGTVSASLNGVSIHEALAAILRSQGLTYEDDDKFIFVTTPEDAVSIKQIESKITTRIYRPKYINGTDLQTLLTPLMSPDVGKIAITTPAQTGLESDNSDGGGDQLTQQDAVLVLDYPHVLVEMDKVVEEMDIPPSQVVIEAMILTVNLSDDLQFGVNFALLSDRSKALTVSGDGSLLNDATGFPPQGLGSGASIVPAAGDFIAQTSGLKFGLIRGDISSFVEALESISDTNLIASPQLRVINKQKAELIIGSRLGYSTFTNNGATSIQNVSFLDVGTKLILRPFISPDGMVRMEIHPERSSGKINTATNLPDTQTTEVTTNVMVRDGTTVVIGGLIDEQTKEEIQRVPLLGALPLIGPAFQNKSENVVRTEMIVLITPRIVQMEQAATAGKAAQTEFETRADRFNSELSPINRNNLTRLYLERAQFYLDRGEYHRALNHAREALRLNKNNKTALAMVQHIEQLLPLAKRPWWRRKASKPADVLPPPLTRLRNYSVSDEGSLPGEVLTVPLMDASPGEFDAPLTENLEPVVPPPEPTAAALDSQAVP